MKWPFGLFGSGARPVFGIDIGTASIKIAALRKREGRIELADYGILDIAGRGNAFAPDAGALRIFERETAVYLAMLAARMGERYARVAAAALPARAAFVVPLDLPPMPEKEIAPALQFKARQYIPLPISSITLDWIRISEQRVLLIGIPNDMIAARTAACRGAGLDVRALELEGVSFARALAPAGDSDTVRVALDIGARGTGIFIVRGGVLMAQGHAEFGGYACTRAIAAGLGMSDARAEDVKRERGMVNTGDGPYRELSTLLRPVLDVIMSEAKRLMERFSLSQSAVPAGIVVAGGGALMPGMPEYVGRALGLPAERAYPLADIAYPARAEAALHAAAPRLIGALGAGLKLL